MEPKKVFILGAGLSKSFCPGMPSINDLTDELFNEKTQPKTEYPELCEYIRSYYKYSNQSKEIRNIENISTAILSKRIFKDDSEKHKYDILRYQILKIIFDKITAHSISSIEDKNLIQRFAKLCNDKSHNSLISFNYDLLIERTGTWVTYGVTNNYPTAVFQDSLGYPTEYIKLHGSFNWYRAKDSFTQDMHHIYRVDEDDAEYSIHKDDVPVFIPMAHTKDSFLNGSLFSTLWAKAAHALKMADEIYFLGYGFPETDLNNLFFFLDYKEKINQIVIYDDESSDNFKRLQSIFGKTLVIKKDAKLFIEENIEAWELSQKLGDPIID